MNPKVGIAAVLLTSAAFTLGFYAKLQIARADTAAGPNTSCSSTTPCLIENNLLSGPGVKSESTHGNGLVATTSALGTTSTNAGSGLLGEDLQSKSGDGLLNFGVSGTSTYGTGVQGTGAIGMAATTNSTSGTGLVVASPNTSLSTTLIKGLGYNGTPVFTVDSAGNAVFGNAGIGVGGGVTVTGYSGNDIPLITAESQAGPIFNVYSQGIATVNGTLAVEPSGTLYAGTINAFNGAPVNVDEALAANDKFYSANPFGSGTNYTATDSAGVTWLYQGYSEAASKYTVEMGDSGSVYARIFITMSAPRIAQQTTSGARVDTFAPQATEPTLEDFGEAQLVDGVATVPVDPRFASAMDTTTRYFVTLTPEGDCKGLYVADRTPAQFVVRELQGGRSSIAFTYRIVAKPLGSDAERLPASALPYGFEHKVPPPVIHRSPVTRPPKGVR